MYLNAHQVLHAININKHPYKENVKTTLASMARTAAWGKILTLCQLIMFCQDIL